MDYLPEGAGGTARPADPGATADFVPGAATGTATDQPRTAAERTSPPGATVSLAGSSPPSAGPPDAPGATCSYIGAAPAQDSLAAETVPPRSDAPPAGGAEAATVAPQPLAAGVGAGKSTAGGVTVAPRSAEAAEDSAATVAPSGAPSAEVGDPNLVPGYEVLGELGRGGMGVVYKARQRGLNRLVALKMILAGEHASAQDLARFRLEGEAIARLHHPNIVQVYEVGEAGGNPYFSLEYVAGGSLAGRIGKAPLAARDAAMILEALARAMDAAHRAGIIHRDLKPANVLLAGGPDTPAAQCVPKITDFGLAKKLEEQDSGHTRTGAIMGTPSYMAPEQAAGQNREVGPLADVYALGAILYDVLTGRPPFRGQTLLDTLTQVLEHEPVPPARLQPGVPRDLETICLKCLQKQPERRYASAGELADDLRRFLHHEPIRARPASAWERGRKWVRRHPTAAALVAVSTLAVLTLAAGGLLFARHEYRRAQAEEALRLAAEQQREEADRQRAQAERGFRAAWNAVDQMLTRVGEERLLHEPRMEKVRRDLLEKAMHFHEQFLSERGDDPALRWESGRAFTRVGDARELLNEYAPAEQAYRQALALFAEAPEADRPEHRRDRAVALNNLANLLEEMGRHGEAEQTYREALAARQQLADALPGEPEYRRDLAASYHNLAVLLRNVGRAPEAEDAFRHALRLQQELADAFSRVPAYRQELATTHNNLGELLQATDRLKETAGEFGQAIGVLARLAKEQHDVPEYRQELAAAHDRLGNLLRDTQPPEAMQAYRQALRLRQELVADFPTVPGYRQELAGSYNNEAILHQAAGRLTDAEKAYGRALDLKERLVADFPAVPEYRSDLAGSLNNHGIFLQTNRRPAEAEKCYRRAIDLLARLAAEFPDVPSYGQQLARTRLNLGTLLQSAGRPADAEKAYREALDVRTRIAARHPDVLDYQQELARTHEPGNAVAAQRP